MVSRGQLTTVSFISLSLALVLQPCFLAYADTTIRNSPGNTGQYILKDSGFITVDANITQSNSDGSGGLIDLQAGTVLTINNGRILDVSATLAGKNGGTINLSAPAILMNGILKTNGMGTGGGGTINLTGLGAGVSGGNSITIGNNAVLEARGGHTGGLGGLINIVGQGNTAVNIGSLARLETSGIHQSGANEIYITGDGSYNEGIAIDNNGMIMALATAGNAGVIRFSATHGGIENRSSGSIVAVTQEMGQGGHIELIADKTLRNAGLVDASGVGEQAGGGNILLSGETTIQRGTVRAEGGSHATGGTIHLNSMEGTVLTNYSVTSTRGNGTQSNAGSVFVWSDKNTAFKPGAIIDVQGGHVSGDGGFAEVSGKDTVYFEGQAFGGAAQGQDGSILIDPLNIVITNAGGSSVTGGDNNGSIDETYAEDIGLTVTYNPQAGGAFNGFQNIWLQATNDITVSNAFDTQTASGNTGGVSLTMEAQNNININAPVTVHNSFITLTADSDSSGAGGLTVASTGSLSSMGGNIALSGSSIAINGLIDAGDGRVVATSTGVLSVDGSTGSGKILSTGAAGASGSETIKLTAGSVLALSGGASNQSGSVIATNGNVRLSSPTSFVNIVGGAGTDSGSIQAGSNVVISSGILTLAGSSGANSAAVIAGGNIDITANGISSITWNGPDSMLFSTSGATAYTPLDDCNYNTNLGMTFNFFGTNYTTGSVTSNGFMWLGNVTERTSAGSNTQSFTGLPASGQLAPRVNAYATDLNSAAGGSWTYRSTGSEFIVTYNDVPWWSSSGVGSQYNTQLALLGSGNSLGLPTNSIVVSFGATALGTPDPAWGANPAFTSGINKNSGSLSQTMYGLGIGQSNGILTTTEVNNLVGRAFAYLPNGSNSYLITEIGTAGSTGGVSASAGSGNLSGAISSTSGAITVNSQGAVSAGASASWNAGGLRAGNVTANSTAGNVSISTVANTVSGSSSSNFVVYDTNDVTVNNVTVGRDLTVTAGSSGSTQNITLTNATVTRNTTFKAGGTVTATAGNNFTGSVSAYGESGTTDYATTVNITDSSGDMTVARITATNGTITAGFASGNLTASNVDTNNGTINFVAPNNITFSTNTVNNTDTINLNSTSNGDITLSSNTISTTITGTPTAPSGTGGVRLGTGANVILNSNTVSGAVAIGTTGTTMQGNITGTGNTFNSTTNFHTSNTKDINLTSNFTNTTTNAFTGDDVTLTDATGTLFISAVTANNLNASATQTTTAGDLTVQNANVSGTSTLSAQDTIMATTGNTNFGTLNATGGLRGGSISITESGAMTIGTVTNQSATNTTALTSSTGSITGKGTTVDDIVSAGTGTVTITASDNTNGYVNLKLNTGRDVTVRANSKNGSNNDSIYLYGTVGRNLVATNSSSNNTTGDIILGDYNSTSNTLNVIGTTQFKSAADVLAYGTFTGALITSNANRVDFWQVGTTNLTIGSVTASATGSAGTELFSGYNNVMNFYVPDAALVEDGDTGTVDLTATNGAITIWTGDNADIGSYIQAGVSTTKDVYLWASGDSNGAAAGGTSINIQTGTIGGKIVAVDETWDKTTGDININLTSGNLTSRDIGSGGNITLTARNGSILQSNDYGFDRNITVYATGNATFQAGDAATDTGSYINNGVYVQGNATFIAAGKSGSNRSVETRGRIDGTTVVQDETSTAVSGDVYMGTSLSDPDNLMDGDVLDTYGDVSINALGTISLNGGVALNGSLTASGSRVTIRQDIGRTRIASITTTATSGNGVDILNYGNIGIFGDGSGIDITTASGASILLQAGNSYPADINAYIDSLSVNSGGNLTIIVTGDSNGVSAGGTSVNITGSVAGTKSATNESGGAPRGSVSMP